MITRADVIKAASGQTQKGHTKSAFGLFLDRWDTEKKAGQEKICEELADEPVINIYEHIGYIWIDITYKNPSEMRRHYNILTEYQKLSGSVDYEKDTVYPVITLAVFPHEFHSKYLLSAFNPILFVLSPDMDGSVNTIRFVFDKDTAEVYINEME